MHILLNGSQKIKKSNSLHFLNYISKNLDEHKTFSLKDDDYLDIVDSIENCDNVVIAFPLYVDSPNTITLSFLDYIFDNKISINKNIYVVINCGFLESKQNITALNIIKNWCEKVGANYAGSVLIGAGEVAGNRKYRLLSAKVYKDLRNFSRCINNNILCNDKLSELSLLNDKLYCFFANLSWNKNGLKNNLNKEDIRKK